MIEELVRKKNFSKVTGSTNSGTEPFGETTKALTSAKNFGKDFGKDFLSNSKIEKFLSKQFANLFSSYTQSFNKVYQRKGSLFIKNFKREPIVDKVYFLNAIVYTHRNPVHHGFYKNYDDWPFSSYHEIKYGSSDIVDVQKVLKTFGGLDSFDEIHARNLEAFENQDYFEIP